MHTLFIYIIICLSGKAATRTSTNGISETCNVYKLKLNDKAGTQLPMQLTNAGLNVNMTGIWRSRPLGNNAS